MNHLEIEESIPLLALGGLSPAEEARLEEHLAVCPSCRALLAEYQFVSAELAEQVPAVPVPAHLEAKLMRQVPAQAARARPAARTREPAARNVGFWRRTVPVARWVMAAAVVAFLLLVGTAAALALQVQRSGFVSPEAVADLFTTHDRKFVSLGGSTWSSKNPEGYVYLSPKNTTALLWLSGLPPIDYDHSYQVWLLHDGMRDNGGLFRPDYEGRAVVLIQAPRPLSDYTDIGITLEPAAGSPAPTSPRVIGGKLE